VINFNTDPTLEISDDDANVFDRLSLQFTVKLLRGQNPALALRIQNIIAPSLSCSMGKGEPPAADDVFALTLDSHTLKRVVETVAAAGQELAEQVLMTQQGDHAYLLVTKEVIGQWLRYARQHQSEQQLAIAEDLD
jgi:hypothetical protein